MNPALADSAPGVTCLINRSSFLLAWRSDPPRTEEDDHCDSGQPSGYDSQLTQGYRLIKNNRSRSHTIYYIHQDSPVWFTASSAVRAGRGGGGSFLTRFVNWNTKQRSCIRDQEKSYKKRHTHFVCSDNSAPS